MSSDEICAYSDGLKFVQEYESCHNDREIEVVYYVVFPNEICVYLYFKDIVNPLENLEEISEIFEKKKKNGCVKEYEWSPFKTYFYYEFFSAKKFKNKTLIWKYFNLHITQQMAILIIT